ncbi:hypothetical protein BDV12DRAFT_165686 [Aspergillus spectabilis]
MQPENTTPGPRSLSIPVHNQTMVKNSLHQRTYLWTDGDCVESPQTTIKRAQSLLWASPTWHSIKLAKRFPFSRFSGVKQSAHMMDIARKRLSRSRWLQMYSLTSGAMRSGYDLVILL